LLNNELVAIKAYATLEACDEELQCYRQLQKLQGLCIPYCMYLNPLDMNMEQIVYADMDVERSKYRYAVVTRWLEDMKHKSSQHKIQCSLEDIIKLMHAFGVTHNDLAGRNVILTDNTVDNISSWFIIDFSHGRLRSTVSTDASWQRKCDNDLHQARLLDQLYTPIMYHDGPAQSYNTCGATVSVCDSAYEKVLRSKFSYQPTDTSKSSSKFL